MKKILIIFLTLSVSAVKSMEDVKEDNSEAVKFYTEKPGNQYWSVGRERVVIKARKEKDKWGCILVVLEPKGFQKKWPEVSVNGWVSCEGPSRYLSRDDWESIIKEKLPQLVLPVDYEAIDGSTKALAKSIAPRPVDESLVICVDTDEGPILSAKRPDFIIAVDTDIQHLFHGDYK